jgi:hypothetical protein
VITTLQIIRLQNVLVCFGGTFPAAEMFAFVRITQSDKAFFRQINEKYKLTNRKNCFTGCNNSSNQTVTHTCFGRKIMQQNKIKNSYRKISPKQTDAAENSANHCNNY